ncbi:cytochrome P450 (plasmid) [Embleya sp. NBC_00888]|uniref:cytochrome P450 family protein n=1 Tax=Embleya sp. NBC_00888 TaxID=2975960 RepID=UPI002F90744F|nr:cytochrome P450 [Embleya sp. NBC_00888]
MSARPSPPGRHAIDTPDTATTHPATAIRLDPAAPDHHGEIHRLRTHGPVAPVLLPGDVPAWAVLGDHALRRVLTHPHVVKDYRAWNLWGGIPADWPLIGMVKVDNAVTADGPEHARLRAPLRTALNPRRITALQAHIRTLTDHLLDRASHQPGPVDLRAHLAAPLPIAVLGHLLGIPDTELQQLRPLVESIFTSTAAPDEVTTTQHAITERLEHLVALRRDRPGDDLTTDLIAHHDQGTLTHGELIGSLWLTVAAGYETTTGLIVNAIHALLTHTDQRTLATTAPRDGDSDPWAAVVTETLRWNSPVGHFLMRYTTSDVTIGDTTIPTGDAVIASYTAAGRDPLVHGDTADRFDITRRPATTLLAFGHGPHLCPGAPLARLQARICLRTLFARFPHITLDTTAPPPRPVPSLVANTLDSLPVRLQ